jgi:hypothetical protein
LIKGDFSLLELSVAAYENESNLFLLNTQRYHKQKPDTKNQKPKTRNQKPETKNQKPKTRNQKPETKNQKPKTKTKKQNKKKKKTKNISKQKVVKDTLFWIHDG